MGAKIYTERAMCGPGSVLTETDTGAIFVVQHLQHKVAYAWCLNDEEARLHKFTREVLDSGWVFENFHVFEHYSPPTHSSACFFLPMASPRIAQRFRSVTDDVWYAMFPKDRVWRDNEGRLYQILHSEPCKSVTLRLQGFHPVMFLLGMRTITLTPEDLLLSYSIAFDKYHT